MAASSPPLVHSRLLAAAANFDYATRCWFRTAHSGQNHFAKLQTRLHGFPNHVIGALGDQPVRVVAIPGAGINGKLGPMTPRGCRHLLGGAWTIHGHD